MGLSIAWAFEVSRGPSLDVPASEVVALQVLGHHSCSFGRAVVPGVSEVHFAARHVVHRGAPLVGNLRLQGVGQLR
jgi:hypothetical protein